MAGSVVQLLHWDLIPLFSHRGHVLLREQQASPDLSLWEQVQGPADILTEVQETAGHSFAA